MYDSPAIDALCSTGQTLAPETREAVLALGEAAIAPLLAILEDDGLGGEDDPGEGWLPIHAVELLAELKATAAIEPMLDMLHETDFDAIVHDRIILRLPNIGPPVLEPVLARLPSAPDDHHFSELCSILADLGVRDERVFRAISANFEEDVIMGAIQLAEYGDPRGLPLVAEAIEDFEIQWSTPAPVYGLLDLVDAYETLAGSGLPPRLQARVDGIRERFESNRRPAPTRKVGRNDPCPCASGKKYKKCCIDSARVA